MTSGDEYTSPLADGVRHLLVCRVALGRVHYTDAKEDADPRGCEDACLKGKYHSILGDRKKCRGLPFPDGTFREFVVFDEEQTYVNYILWLVCWRFRSRRCFRESGVTGGMGRKVQESDGVEKFQGPGGAQLHQLVAQAEWLPLLPHFGTATKPWVDGKNPDNPQAAEVSDWLREQKIDPYLIPRDEIEDWRRQYLMRKHYPEYDVDKTKPEAEQQAEAEDPWGRLCKRKGHVVQRWQRMYPLSE
ncbi:unnamed protein product [Effrenium voratum]|nr:unnamed protein product [Effrenium voratum]